MTHTLDLKNIKLGELLTSSKGAKTIPLTTSGNTILWQPVGDYVPCFEPSAFNDPEASRVNMSLMMTAGLEIELNQLDAHLCSALAEDSQRCFGQVLTEAQIKERMQQSVRKSDKGHKSWRLKMNISGRAKCLCYDEERKLREQPESWSDVSLKPQVAVKAFWMMNKEFGLIYELQAVQICETVKVCPFL
jgi:hypothetical protein